jgi:hypothetical protein
MRVLTAGQTTLLQGGTYDVYAKVEVTDSAGAWQDRTSDAIAVEWEQTTDELVNACTVEFRRNDGTAATFAPLMSATPPVDTMRGLRVSVATVAVGATPVAGDYEAVFDGAIDRVRWPQRYPGRVVAECRDTAGALMDHWIQEVRTYGSDAGVALETVMQQVLDDNGFSGITLYAPTATSAVVTPAYEQGKEPVMQALRTLAESIGWTVRYRYIDSLSAWRLTLYEPDRDKAITDFTFGTSQYYDVTAMEIGVEDIRNKIKVESPNTDGSRSSSGTPVSDSASITKYSPPGLTVERYMEIIEASDSPIVGETKRAALANAALSDLAEPDAVVELHGPLWWPGELGVDLYSITANSVHFSSNQTLAPTHLRHRIAAGERAETRIGLRGKPTGGQLMWRQREKRQGGALSIEEQFGLVDFREVAPATAGNRRWAWTRRGSEVSEVWFAFRLYSAPWADDNWADAKTYVVPIPDAQDYIEIANADLPNASQIGALWVEPRIDRGGSLTVYNDSVIERVKVDPVPADLDVDISAAIVSNAVDLTLKLTQASGAKVYPATALVYEGSESGTLLATIPFSADGTRTKADASALGGRSLPAEGKQAWVAVVTDVAGNVYRDRAEVNAPRNPYFDGVRSVLSADLLSVDIFGTVTDPAGLGGTLEWWLPTDASTPANPSGAASGSKVLAVGDMPYTFSPANTAAFNDFNISGSGFGLFLKFVATDGRSTGVQKFTLDASMQFLVNTLGKLKAESVHNGLVLAAAYRPYYMGSAAPTLTPDDYGTDLFFNSSTLTAYKYNTATSAWDVDNSTPAVQYSPILRAGVVTAEVLEATAVRAKLVGAERITGDNIVATLSLVVGQSVQSTTYTAGSAGWSINAAGDAEFNNVTIRGTLVGVTGTFAGDLSAAGGTFAGNLTATTVEVHGGLWLTAAVSAAAAMLKWGDGLPGSTGRLKPDDAAWTSGSPGFAFQYLNLSSVWEDVFDFDMPSGNFTADGALNGASLNVGTGAVTAGNATLLAVTADGTLQHNGSNAGFYGTVAVAKPGVSGSRGGNAALDSLCNALASLGLITNSTTA